MKSGFISIIGRPNVGKSTLLNAVIGEKVAITTDKPQTTRNVIRGIYTDAVNETQMVFIDTPGIHKPKNRLGSYMTDSALGTFDEVDAILFLVDDVMESGTGDKYIVDLLKKTKTPKYLVINKMDLMGPDKYAKIFSEYDELGIFEDIFGVSVLKGTNVTDITKTLGGLMPEGPMFFPADMMTDYPERFLVSEIIREKTLLYLNEEVPHGIAVVVEKFEEKDDIDDISAVIYCEKKSHKGIIIGKGGRKLKGIGKAARVEIEALLGCRVYMELWVKVKENWRDSAAAMANFGYKDM
ncbi:MAG: GTPase Era [Anaerovoracaceae bacterium]|nr:GTPase Era [Anaerovoracaceae bacterium]